MIEALRSDIDWRYHRLVNSAYPPIDLFEDIADPADWELLARAESRTNPRLSASIGNLDLVAVERRVSGVGSSYLMAPFVHCSPDKPGRFHDGSFGAFYGADSYETALFETIHHTGLFCAATKEAPGWIADMREVIGNIKATLIDLREGTQTAFLDPDDYRASQDFARSARDAGEDGIVYTSVRNDGGECFAAFHPDVPNLPQQGRHIGYHWNGTRIDKIREYSETRPVYEVGE